MSAAFRFDPVELPPECEALRAEVRVHRCGIGGWAVGAEQRFRQPPVRGVQPAARGARGRIGMTWPKRYGGGERPGG